MSITITVDASEFDAIMRKLTSPEVDRRAQGAMNESLAYLENKLVAAAPVNTGNFRGSIFNETRGRGLSIRGVVGSPLPYGPVIEHGRRPGSFPPRGPIELWTARVLGDASLWFVVARAIARRGIPGRFIFRDTAKRSVRAIESIWARHFTV